MQIKSRMRISILIAKKMAEDVSLSEEIPFKRPRLEHESTSTSEIEKEDLIDQENVIDGLKGLYLFTFLNFDCSYFEMIQLPVKFNLFRIISLCLFTLFIYFFFNVNKNTWDKN